MRDPDPLVSTMGPECPTKDCLGKFCWLRPKESSPVIDQGPGGVTYLRPCFALFQNFWNFPQ